MRFMTLVKSREGSGPPPRALMDAIANLGAEAFKNGTLVQMGGLTPSASGARVRLANGKIVVTDGPFTEAKEVIGGFAVYEAQSLKEATGKVVTAAAQVSAPVHVLIAGQGADAVAAAAAKLSGVEKVLLADDALYAKMVAETMETLILSLADKYDAILAPATTNGKNYMPRVAAKLDVPQVSEIIAVESPDTFQRPIYAGNAIATDIGCDRQRRFHLVTVHRRLPGHRAEPPRSAGPLHRHGGNPDRDLRASSRNSRSLRNQHR